LTYSLDANFTGSINLTNTGLLDYAPHINSIYPDSFKLNPTPSPSVAAVSAPIDSDMTLAQCLGNLTETFPYYNSFAASLTNISRAVNTSHSRLSNIELVTTNILSQEATFTKELDDLQSLYNQVASRSNTLGTWMGEEKQIRDQLAVFYNGMTVLNTQKRAKLSEMASSLNAAQALLGDIDRRASLVLQGTADAALVTRPWALNVTTSADAHTLRLDSLAASMEWRIQQMRASAAEQLKMAKVAKAMAMHYHNASLIEQASSVLLRITQ
jgi:hypothetical protein